ncbi:MAG: hypothetical protein LQ352_000615 [Teloschistes flavicans]|nr:MAG: hypothetical protein LQ352_000615 [Teloschistes flavicans]
MLHQRRQLVRILSRRWRVQQRRYESKSAKGDDITSTAHQASAGKHEPTHHDHHPEPVNESLALPLSFAVYKFSRSSDGSSDEAAQPWLTRMIGRYDSWQQAFGERNALHTKMLEQAGHDRNLFYNSPRSEMVDLSFPEIFNTGSPYNVPAGHGANLDELIAHYKKKNAEQDAKTRERMERRAAELRPEKSATLSGQNPAGAPQYSTVTPSR